MADFDFSVLGTREHPTLGLDTFGDAPLDGAPVGSGATLANPEKITVPDPQPGTYTLVADNYAGGTAQYDWSGTVSFRNPNPPSPTGTKEAWLLSCSDKRGNVLATREVIVDRGEAVDVGNACKRNKE